MQPPIPASKPDWQSLGLGQSFRDRLMGSNPRLSTNVEDRRGQKSPLEALYLQIRDNMINGGGIDPEEADAALDDVRRQSSSAADEEAWLRQIWAKMNSDGADYWRQP